MSPPQLVARKADTFFFCNDNWPSTSAVRESYITAIVCGGKRRRLVEKHRNKENEMQDRSSYSTLPHV